MKSGGPPELEVGPHAPAAHYTRPMAEGWWASSIAWGGKSLLGEDYDAFAVESSVNYKHWTLFGRGEITENNELVEIHDEVEEGGGHHGEALTVGKLSLGLVRDFRIAEHLELGVGGLYSLDFVPPRELGRRCGERTVAELALDNLGICRFQREWAEDSLDELLLAAGTDPGSGVDARHRALAQRLAAGAPPAL